MTLRRLVAGLLAVTVATAAGCGLDADDEVTRHAAEDVPFGLLEPATTTSRPAGGGPTTSVRVCLARGDVVVPLTRETGEDDVLRASIDLVEAGPVDASETASGLTTAVPEGAVTAIEVDGGVAEVSLVEGLGALQTGDQLLAVAQLVCTLTSQRGVGQVTFLLGGTDVDVPVAGGSLTTGPVTRDDYRDLITSG